MLTNLMRIKLNESHVETQFAVEVLRVIGLSPCQPDHAFESSTMIKVITMQILWPSSSL